MNLGNRTIWAWCRISARHGSLAPESQVVKSLHRCFNRPLLSDVSLAAIFSFFALGNMAFNGTNVFGVPAQDTWTGFIAEAQKYLPQTYSRLALLALINLPIIAIVLNVLRQTVRVHFCACRAKR